MGCSKCHTTQNTCTCTTKKTCVTEDCSCKVRIGSDCWTYTGDDLECSGILKDTIGTEAIQQLDAFICDKFDEVQNFFTITNVGDGAESYKGVNLLGQKELRTITKTGDLIVVTENEDEIDITIDEAELTAFVEALDTDTNNTYSVDNLSDGAEIYKDSTVVGDNTQFNLRTLKSDTLIITQNADDITIETEDPDLNGVRDFIVNTRYTGDEEIGTVAKPYKTLDAAITDYIGSGTRLAPEFGGSRILCTGGQSHNFAENLSINNLILEVESGTTIRYTGADLYPIDFRTLQTSAGGYGTQDRSLRISIRGAGTIITNTLFAYTVNSGHTVSGTRRTNLLSIENTTILSLYKLADFVSGITRSDLSPWISNTREAVFYFGDIDEPCIVVEGQNGVTDNSNSILATLNNVKLTCISQQTMLVDSARCTIDNSSFLQEYNDGTNNFVIADDTALVGTVLTESPTLSYTLPNPKDDLCVIKIQGNGTVDINGGQLTAGFNITLLEAWYKVVDDDARITIKNSSNLTTLGGSLASNFIETGAFHPTITITNTEINKTLATGATFINTSVNPFTKATVNGNKFTFGIASNIDLTRANAISVVNTFAGKIKESLQKFASRVLAVAGGLTSGDIFVNRKTVTAGSFIAGEEYVISAVNTTDFTLIGAASNTVGLNFTATGVGVGDGEAFSFKRDIIL